MAARKPLKKKKAWNEPCEYIDSLDPKECPPHGEPRDPKGKPVLCLKCNEAINGGGHRCFRHVKPKPQAQIEQEQKAEDDRIAAQTWAQQHHRKRQAKMAVKEPEREWMLGHPRITSPVKARTKSEARSQFKSILRGPIPKGSEIRELTS